MASRRRWRPIFHPPTELAGLLACRCAQTVGLLGCWPARGARKQMAPSSSAARQTSSSRQRGGGGEPDVLLGARVSLVLLICLLMVVGSCRKRPGSLELARNLRLLLLSPLSSPLSSLSQPFLLAGCLSPFVEFEFSPTTPTRTTSCNQSSKTPIAPSKRAKRTTRHTEPNRNRETINEARILASQTDICSVILASH